MPQKPSSDVVAYGTQASRRFMDTFFDVHKSARFPAGRPWCGTREYAANADQGHPPGFVSADLQPGEYIPGDREASFKTAWNAPWFPEAKYWRFDYNRKLISFEYRLAEQQERMMLERWWNLATDESAMRGWESVEQGKPIPYPIRRLLGDPPKRIPIFQAAQANDPWLLGFTETPNHELAQVLGLTVVSHGAGDYRAFGTPNEYGQSGLIPRGDLLTLSTEDLNAKIAAAVAQALEAQASAKHAKQKASMAKARAAKKPVPIPVPV